MRLVTWLIGIAFSGSLTLFGQTPTQDALPPPPDGQPWKLVWSDEFDGAQLDETKWNRLGDWKRHPNHFEVDYVRVYEAVH